MQNETFLAIFKHCVFLGMVHCYDKSFKLQEKIIKVSTDKILTALEIQNPGCKQSEIYFADIKSRIFKMENSDTTAQIVYDGRHFQDVLSIDFHPMG